ncbi:MAG: hypothetical protein L6246_07730 [Thermodesulfovibrionales bacterium]|nr:hypothetical protein [Thermodesulfovibrionales bacterium]
MSKTNFNLPTTGNTGSVTTKSHLPAQTQQMSFTVEELLAKIDQVKSAGFGPEPALFDLITSPGARELKRTIEDAKASAVRARRELIDGLASCIVVYVDTHKADLKIRGSAFVTTTLVTLTGKLNAIVESVITSFFETYSRTVEDYERIPNLTDDVRQELRQNALDRARRIAELSQSSFFDILNNLKEQVIKLSNEIGER